MLNDQTVLSIHKLLCENTQVGTTSWRRMFVQWNSNNTFEDALEVDAQEIYAKNAEKYWPSLSESNITSDIQYRIDNYFRFLFVRHPLDRILSAYEHRFNSTCYRCLHEVAYRQIMVDKCVTSRTHSDHKCK